MAYPVQANLGYLSSDQEGNRYFTASPQRCYGIVNVTEPAYATLGNAFHRNYVPRVGRSESNKRVSRKSDKPREWGVALEMREQRAAGALSEVGLDVYKDATLEQQVWDYFAEPEAHVRKSMRIVLAERCIGDPAAFSEEAKVICASDLKKYLGSLFVQIGYETGSSKMQVNNHFSAVMKAITDRLNIDKESLRR